MTILMTILGLLAGVGLTLAVYPSILQRRAKTLLQRCSGDSSLGDPTSNYLSLLMFQTTQAYDQLQQGRKEESHAELVNILAAYAAFLTMKSNRSESEQGTLDAIRRACNDSEKLRHAVDAQVGSFTGKSTAQLLDELETELANHTPEGIRRPADGSPKPSV